MQLVAEDEKNTHHHRRPCPRNDAAMQLVAEDEKNANNTSYSALAGN